MLSEAIVNGVPVLASRIDATEGILGESYPGMFRVGDTQRLTELLHRAEMEPSFRRQLIKSTQRMKPRLQPEYEVKAWKQLVGEFGI